MVNSVVPSGPCPRVDSLSGTLFSPISSRELTPRSLRTAKAILSQEGKTARFRMAIFSE